MGGARGEGREREVFYLTLAVRMRPARLLMVGTKPEGRSLRVRLAATFDDSGFPPQARVILLALKRYGMLLADNGSDWYVSGAPDARWDDDQLGTLKSLRGSDFEVVQLGPLTTP